MSTNINANLLKTFIVKTIGADKITQNQIQKFDIEQDKYADANKDENAYLELDEIIADKDLYEQFATMYVEEQKQKQDTANADKEKEEAEKVQDKGESKA